MKLLDINSNCTQCSIMILVVTKKKEEMTALNYKKNSYFHPWFLDSSTLHL